MRMRCVGGGPAGLMFAILAGPVGHRVTVLEHRTRRPRASAGEWCSGTACCGSSTTHDPQTGRGGPRAGV